MNLDSIRALCLSFPHASEQIQWGNDLLFKVAGKMFAVMALEPASVVLSFKCSDENFHELLENEGVVPAPYMARNRWVALQRFDALPSAQLAQLLRGSYDLVFAKLPKRTQGELAANGIPSRKNRLSKKGELKRAVASSKRKPKRSRSR
jgi:predicted DNA-binding protein (MmcQ/YjbR family)